MGSSQMRQSLPSRRSRCQKQSSVNGQPPNEAEPSIKAQTLSEAESSVNGQPPN